MQQRFRYYVIKELQFAVELHGAVLDAADSQKVLHQADQPDRVVVNIRIEPMPCLFLEVVARAEKIAGVSGYGSQRRAQIVGYGAQEIGS